MAIKLPLDKILFLDIETVPEKEHYDQLDLKTQDLWDKKSSYKRKDETAEAYYPQASIWAEFGKIICISVGFFSTNDHQHRFRVKSFFGDEVDLLQRFKSLIDQYYNQRNQLLCAHNGKEFDFPYIARRMIINNISLPKLLDISGKKPWEVAHLDTMEMWRFGDYKHHTSIELLTHILGIPSPKNDIDGSMVREVYYREGDLTRIVEYCEQDTIAVAQLYLRLTGQQILEESNIIQIPINK